MPVRPSCVAVNILNFVAGNAGETVRFGAGLAAADGYAALAELTKAMGAGEIALALVHDANPAYTLPRATGFTDAFRKVGYKVSTALHLDETAALCDLLLPQHHALERWDDLRPRAGARSHAASDGAGLRQPSRRATSCSGSPRKPAGRFDAPSYEAHLKTRWQSLAGELGEGDFNAFWHGALQRGGVFRESPPVASVSPTLNDGSARAQAGLRGRRRLRLRDLPERYAVRRSRNQQAVAPGEWRPVTKITWHSWVEVGLGTAWKLDVGTARSWS